MRPPPLSWGNGPTPSRSWTWPGHTRLNEERGDRTAVALAIRAIRYEPVGSVPLNGLTAPITLHTVRAD